ncbi:CTTNBP 2 amino-terminal-like protein [Quillaja saponaria]|uniref:CTTNBP 2 amino-terminal-like protein n=1 Tax=Quillaja saponaria TaxID=32244 RepID=A0AAD7M2B5_QUISA|nr:CTTNBP 2 amino-terminal-like protein [Quillaja saponaria]
MIGEDSHGWPPIGSPLTVQRDEHWRNFDSSVDAVSFGFVATAILISMFLVMAIFERFLRPTSPLFQPSGGRSSGDIESQMGFNGKLGHPSPKMTVYANGVSVLMPGDNIPTFIAHPAPVPCSPEQISWPPHQHNALLWSTSNSHPNMNSA